MTAHAPKTAAGPETREQERGERRSEQHGDRLERERGDVRGGELPRGSHEQRRQRQVARPVCGERHGGEHGKDVDDGDVGVDRERDRGPEAGEGPDEMDDDQDPLSAVAVADDGDERRHQRARDHASEEDEPDGARAVRLERDDAQGDERGPFSRVEAAPRELRPAKRRVLPQLTNRGKSRADTTGPHAREHLRQHG